MTTQCHLIKMKAELKETAKEIRNLKSKRKELKGYVPGLGNAQYKFRVNHIAYCLLRGRTIEQIEPKTRNPESYELKSLYKEVNKIVDSILNPKSPMEVSNGTKDLRTSGQDPVALTTDSSIWSRIAKSFR